MGRFFAGIEFLLKNLGKKSWLRLLEVLVRNRLRGFSGWILVELKRLDLLLTKNLFKKLGLKRVKRESKMLRIFKKVSKVSLKINKIKIDEFMSRF